MSFMNCTLSNERQDKRTGLVDPLHLENCITQYSETLQETDRATDAPRLPNGTSESRPCRRCVRQNASVEVGNLHNDTSAQSQLERDQTVASNEGGSPSEWGVAMLRGSIGQCG